MLQADDEDDVMDQQMKSPFGSSFRTFDATDYEPIATVDVKRNIFDLCTDTKDCYLAVIENQDSISLDTICRLYEVGRQKLAEEGDDDQDDEDQDDDSSDTDDDDDDDDDVLDIDPLLQELADIEERENEEQENRDSANSPADAAVAEELADIFGSSSSDNNNNDHDASDSDQDGADASLELFGDGSDDDDDDDDEDSELFQSLPDRWFS